MGDEINACMTDRQTGTKRRGGGNVNNIYVPWLGSGQSSACRPSPSACSSWPRSAPGPPPRWTWQPCRPRNLLSQRMPRIKNLLFHFYPFARQTIPWMIWLSQKRRKISIRTWMAIISKLFLPYAGQTENEHWTNKKISLQKTRQVRRGEIKGSWGASEGWQSRSCSWQPGSWSAPAPAALSV